MKLASYISIGAACLAGCATGYHAMDWSGGYEETRLGENIVSISFRGNQHSTEQRVQDFAFLRAADLALESGFTYLAIIYADKHLVATSNIAPAWSPTSELRFYQAQEYLDSRSSVPGTIYAQTATPSISIMVIFFKEKPLTSATVLSASYIAYSIRSKYQLE